MTDDETIIVIRHKSQQGETYIWLLTDQTAPTIEDDLRRLWLERRLTCRECLEIERHLEEAMVMV